MPLTSRIDRVYPSEAVVEFAGERNKAMADQVTTAAKSRLLQSVGQLNSRDMEAIDHVLALQLGLALSNP